MSLVKRMLTKSLLLVKDSSPHGNLKINVKVSTGARMMVSSVTHIPEQLAHRKSYGAMKNQKNFGSA